MSRFIKGAGKGLGNLAEASIKQIFTAVLTEIVGDLMKESDMGNIAKEKLIATGLKLVKEMNIDPKKIQRDLIKTALKKELGL